MFLFSRHRSLAVAATAVLVMASCGSSSSDATTTTTTESAADTSVDTTSESTTDSTAEPSNDSVGIDITKFFDGALVSEPTTEECTLSGGAETTCYNMTVAGYPQSHDTGPFCPEKITDSADAGGIWFDGDKVYDLDGPFIENLATTYGDEKWEMYDDQGNVLVTETAEEFEAAARPDVDPDLENHCVQGALEWLENGEPMTSTVLIPAVPVVAERSSEPRGTQGVTLDGIVIAEPAPVDAIMGAYTIAAFDDCGGHYNPFEGYHLHGATGCSEVGEATEGDPPIFGYAMDGYAVHSPFTDADSQPDDLDECNGHTTEADGYHYHANSVEKNQVIECLRGQTSMNVDDERGAGGPPDGGTPPE